jgi:hypothetical protein
MMNILSNLNFVMYHIIIKRLNTIASYDDQPMLNSQDAFEKYFLVIHLKRYICFNLNQFEISAMNKNSKFDKN